MDTIFRRLAGGLAFALASAGGYAASLTPPELAAEVIRSTPIKSAARVEATVATDARYTYFVWYKQGEGSVAKARADTQKLVRATLSALVKQGVKPAEDWKFIHAHGVEEVRGETRKMAAELGDAAYNFTTDQIEFKPPSLK
ncbi:hypothetical protein [Rhodoferax koreensis]|uniref:hypothetical protein n=1 Tax=Rhodoferax koreensis TaxID=1842727 RepID=UPI0012FF911A|nr:hypothetical protein [Rhodoferax koreense]